VTIHALPTSGEYKPGQIIVNNRPLRDVSSDLLAAIRLHNDPPEVFVRAGALVRVRTDEDGRPIVDIVGETLMRHRLSVICDTVRQNKDGRMIDVSPPVDAVRDVLARGIWPVPGLAAVTEIPTLRPDGTIHDEAGYDAPTRIVHVPARSLAIPTVIPFPTTTDVTGAVALLDELLVDFPFDGAADRANALAALLTPVVRPAIQGHVPLCLLDAPEPGTGKGLLANVIGAIATGRAAAMKPVPTHEEEIRKMITSTLLEGATIVVLDNVDDAIRSPSLASLLTSDTWADRILGRSEIAQLPNRATWLATGNNLTVGGDLARRCYRVRLDAKQARPYLRSGFRHDDLVQWTLEHRGELLAALLTLAVAWWSDGRPVAPDCPTLGGFTHWAQTIAGILHHAGIEGFLANQLAFLETADTEALEWETFLTAWNDRFGAELVTTAEVVTAAEPDSSVLHDVVPEGVMVAKDPAKTLGRRLTKRLGRHYGEAGWHLALGPRDSHAKTNRWRVTTRDAGSAGSRGSSNGSQLALDGESEKTDIQLPASLPPSTTTDPDPVRVVRGVPTLNSQDESISQGDGAQPLPRNPHYPQPEDPDTPPEDDWEEPF
jgi:hypothetical protein